MNYDQVIRELQDNLLVITEITDKLNGLIGYMDGQGPRRPS